MRVPCLYRCFDRKGLLLYVGCSSNVGSRLASHAQQTDWWPLVWRIAVKRVSTLDQCRREEQRAIRDEYPKFNVAHSRPTEKLARRLVLKAASFRGTTGSIAKESGVTYDDALAHLNGLADDGLVIALRNDCWLTPNRLRDQATLRIRKVSNGARQHGQK